ncbi:MAG: type II toxin-antitoxin system RelE/ParE family toxin [Cellvibrionaceae bacterium]|nr:type II toxin-antitoxin system RelE/ParE family toxin [Cellvibrionaceae bacterium]
MDYQVIWSPEALDDIDDIAEYIAKDSPLYAQSTVEQMVLASRSLSRLPMRGRRVPELNDDSYREHFIASYRMIYRVLETEVQVLAVIHGARLLGSIERFDTP